MQARRELDHELHAVGAGPALAVDDDLGVRRLNAQ
jgi:hypothetical protein